MSDARYTLKPCHCGDAFCTGCDEVGTERLNHPHPVPTPTPFRAYSPSALYIVDNGALLCGEHLGASAKYTGRDISGQPIHRCTPQDSADAISMGFSLRCETCAVVGMSDLDTCRDCGERIVDKREHAPFARVCDACAADIQ